MSWIVFKYCINTHGLVHTTPSIHVLYKGTDGVLYSHICIASYMHGTSTQKTNAWYHTKHYYLYMFSIFNYVINIFSNICFDIYFYIHILHFLCNRNIFIHFPNTLLTFFQLYVLMSSFFIHMISFRYTSKF